MSDLRRFLDAQAQPHGGFEDALAELEAGAKRGHWIWYLFPQLAGLGVSSTSVHYALRDIEEAKDFLAEPTLRARLLALTRALSRQLRGSSRLEAVMGSRIDASKVVSSLTLFRAAARAVEVSAAPECGELGQLADEVLGIAERQGYPPCRFTEAALAKSQR